MYREKLDAAVKEILKNDTTGHDIHHSMRVYNLAKAIAEGEGWAFDDDILFATAMLHDSGHERSKSTGDAQRLKHMGYGAEIAQKILAEVGFPEHKIQPVLQGILLHDETKPWGIDKRTPTNVKEILLIQDADNLEGMGNLGMARILIYGFEEGKVLFDPTLSLTENLAESRKSSSLHNLIWHLDLDENLNTRTAKQMAQERKVQAKNFIEQFLKEWNSS
jgi:uncharacterized protein